MCDHHTGKPPARNTFASKIIELNFGSKKLNSRPQKRAEGDTHLRYLNHKSVIRENREAPTQWHTPHKRENEKNPNTAAEFPAVRGSTFKQLQYSEVQLYCFSLMFLRVDEGRRASLSSLTVSSSSSSSLLRT